MPGATRARRPFWRHPLTLAIGGGAVTAALVSVVLVAAFDSSGSNQTDPDDTPVATSTPTEMPETPEPTPTPTVPGPGNVLTNETFDDPASAAGHAFQDETGAGIVANGELQLIDTADDGSLVWTQWHLLQEQVSFQLRGFADVRVLTMACDDGANQIRASVSSRTSSYKVVIFNIDASEFTTLIDWTVSPAIPQDQKSTLQLLCQLSAMSFIINGETVASFDMPNVRADTVWVAADGGVDASVFVDDVLITLP